MNELYIQLQYIEKYVDKWMCRNDGVLTQTMTEEWNVERTEDIRETKKNENEKAKRDETLCRRSKERSSEFTHARHRRLYVAGKHKTSDGYILNFFITCFVYASNYKWSCLCGNISVHFY